MKEWNVYINGTYVGTVDAKDRIAAVRAAYSKYDVWDDDIVSVSER